MRRSLALLLLALAALGTTAFAPAADGASVAQDRPMVCVTFRDSTVPGTTITIRRPTDRVCVRVMNPSELPVLGDA